MYFFILCGNKDYYYYYYYYYLYLVYKEHLKQFRDVFLQIYTKCLLLQQWNGLRLLADDLGWDIIPRRVFLKKFQCTYGSLTKHKFSIFIHSHNMYVLQVKIKFRLKFFNPG